MGALLDYLARHGGEPRPLVQIAGWWPSSLGYFCSSSTRSSQCPVWWVQISMGTVSGLAQPLQQVQQVFRNPPLRFLGGGRAWHTNNISDHQLKIWQKYLLTSADWFGDPSFFLFFGVWVCAGTSMHLRLEQAQGYIRLHALRLSQGGYLIRG